MVSQQEMTMTSYLMSTDTSGMHYICIASRTLIPIVFLQATHSLTQSAHFVCHMIDFSFINHYCELTMNMLLYSFTDNLR